MICSYNNEYYIKRFSKLIKVNAIMNKNGGVSLIATNEKIIITDDIDYKVITIDDVKNNLKAAEKKAEKAEEEKVVYNKNKKFN